VQEICRKKWRKKVVRSFELVYLCGKVTNKYRKKFSRPHVDAVVLYKNKEIHELFVVLLKKLLYVGHIVIVNHRSKTSAL